MYSAHTNIEEIRNDSNLETSNNDRFPLELFRTHYISSLIWSEGEHFNDYTQDNFTRNALTHITEDCTSFYTKAHILLTDAYYSIPYLAHDFALTRNQHGAGFWDGDWRSPFDGLLTTLSDSYQPQHLYLTDDNQLDVL